MRLPLRRCLRPLALALAILSCGGDAVVGPRTEVAPSFDVGAASTDLVINEFIADPAGTDTQGEWIEIYNPGTGDVDLLGYKIASGPGIVTVDPPRAATDNHTVQSSVIVPAGGYAVLGNNANSATNGGIVLDYAYPATGVGSITLNNANTDWITIKKPDGTLVDSVAYSVSTVTISGATATRTIGTPAFTPAAGASRALVDLTADNTIAATSAWANAVSPYGTGASRGTPGQPNLGGPPATVSVRVSWVTPGTSFTITASAFDADGKPTFAAFSWSVDDPSIATIDPITGRATGVSLGVARVTATAASTGASGTSPLFVVNPGDVASIALSMNDPRQIPPHYTKPIFPTVRTTTNEVVTPTLIWSSSDENVATVSDLGYVTAVAPGKATIRATAPDGVYGETDVTVIPADAPTSAVYRNHLEFGIPTDNTPGDEFLIADRRQYALSYNKNRGGPNWVSADINATHFGGAPRCDCFSADLALPSDFPRIVDFDYRNGGYDRGHMMQSEPRTTTDQENAATFLLSNILPQGAENNQGPWAQFEIYLNDLARLQGKEIYVIMGGEYAASPGTLKGEGKVAIPDYTWKVAVIMDGGKGVADVHSASDLQVIAVRMPNLTTPNVPASSVGIRNTPWQGYTKTVNEIEALTGYNLLDRLPDDVEIQVEGGNRRPVANVVATPTLASEGAPVTFNASGSTDPDEGDVLTYLWAFGDGVTGQSDGPVIAHTYRDNGTYTTTVTVSDRAGESSSATATVEVTNVAPVIATFETPAGPVRAGSEVGARLTFTDAGADDTHQVVVSWGDGSTSTPIAAGGVAEARHAYASAGLYTISAVVRDDDGGSDSRAATSYLAVYDPAAGSVAGGGWFTSPRSKVTFALNVAYQGATPRGLLELNLHGEDFSFLGSDVEWLAVADGRATVKGTGRLKGKNGVYGFLATAIDAPRATDGAGDRVRIRIWDASGRVVYDNQPGAADGSSAGTQLGGGNLTVFPVVR